MNVCSVQAMLQKDIMTPWTSVRSNRISHKPTVPRETMKFYFGLSQILIYGDVTFESLLFIAGSCMAACSIYCAVWRSRSRQIIKRHWGLSKSYLLGMGLLTGPWPAESRLPVPLEACIKRGETPLHFHSLTLTSRDKKRLSHPLSPFFL